MWILIPLIIFLIFRYRNDTRLRDGLEKIGRSFAVWKQSSGWVIDGYMVDKTWFEQFGLFYIHILLAMIVSVVVYFLFGALWLLIILMIYMQNKQFQWTLQKYLSYSSEKIYNFIDAVFIQTTKNKKKPPWPVEQVPRSETHKKT